LHEEIVVHIDGGSRGNPGPAAAGFVIKLSSGGRLKAQAFFLGRATNNVAEYTGLVKALETAKQINAEKLSIFSDSELLVKQINGQYKVKSEHIIPLYKKAVTLLNLFPAWKIQHVPREKNKLADKLVNQALDCGHDIVCQEEPAAKKENPIRLGVLISGGGRTLINILENIKAGRLNAKISLVISSLSNVAGVGKARNAGLKVKIIRKQDYPDIEQFSRRIEEELTAEKVDLVIQAGWMCLWKIPDRFQNRVMNIHPALLPSFGGKGMWGHHVHEAVLKAGCKVSGCTIHFCTNEYDRGPIIIQRTCPVCEGDTADTLAARVFEQECIAYPEAIRLFADGKLLVQDSVVQITS
jgi:phosphoribosylglycinamide formyltransferase 1